MLVPIIVRSQAGIRRDGTVFASDFYVDGQWVRFQRQLARKMGGYIALSHSLSAIVRSLLTFVVNEFTYAFVGTASSLEYFYLDIEGNSSIVVNRTPLELNQNPNNTWQLDIILDVTSLIPVNQIVAHCAPNGKSLGSISAGQLFLGNLVDTAQSGTPLEDISWALDSQNISISGGAFSLHPYLVTLGNDGTVAWSAPAKPRWFNQNLFVKSTTKVSADVGKGNIYVPVNQDTSLALGEVIAFGDATPIPYAYYGIKAKGMIDQVLLSMVSPLPVDVSAGTSVCEFFAYPTIQTPYSFTGKMYCEFVGDVAKFFPVGAYFDFTPNATPLLVTESYYSAGNGTTTVNVNRVISNAPAGAFPFILLPSLFVTFTVSPLGTNVVLISGSGLNDFPIGAYIGFGTPYEAVNQYTLLQISSRLLTTIYGLTLTNPLQTDIAINTEIYLQGTVPTGAGNARIAAQKLVKGLPLRGGPANSPAGLIWSTDALLRMSFVGGDTTFQFDTISPSSSILSANSVIEYDGVYFWVGSDRFLSFNGVVQEVPNDQNINWFFDNINRQYKSRVFAFKVPRYSEIWWCFPYGNATECTHAVIYNIRENCWYDTKLPNGGRSAGQFMANFGRPLLTGVEPYENANGSFTYRVWQHEQGVDEIDRQNIFPILSYIETASFSLPAQSQGKLKNLRVAVVEPDFLQKGDMSVTISGQANARSKVVYSEEIIFPDTAYSQGQQIACFKEERRLLRFKFQSNVIGGDFQMGKILAQVEEADGTYLGAFYGTASAS